MKAAIAIFATLFACGILAAVAWYGFRSSPAHRPASAPMPQPAPVSDHRTTKSYQGKRVLEVDSYHEGFGWTASITRGVKTVLNGSGAELKVLRLDTKRNPSEEFKKEAALRAKKTIEEFKPDVVIGSDDNVSKYLIVPFYKDANLPFVFCGVNWTAAEYGYPFKNVTGQIEVTHIKETMALLETYAKGESVGILISDTFTEHKDVENFRKVLGVEFKREYYVKTYAEWKEKFVRIQREVDMMILGSFPAIPDFDREDALTFVFNEYRIPSGTTNAEFMPYAHLGVVKDPAELGRWAARTALRILDGTAPADIPIVRNKVGRLYLNLRLAKKLNIVFEPDLLPNATIIREETPE